MKASSKLFKDFQEAEKVYRVAEKKLERHFKKQVDKAIEEATTMEQLKEVKDFLRNMPQIVGKVFLFRDILMRENEIKSAGKEN